MQDDLISRQAAIDAVMNTEPVFDVNLDPYQKTKDVIKALSELPSAQPERKTGRWTSGDKMRDYPRVPYRAWKTYCSECCEEALLDMDCSDYMLTPYCPNCGAKMEVEQ